MKPTAAQRQALEDIKLHGDPWYRVHGQAQHGGWSSVMAVIARRRWATRSKSVFAERPWKLTAKGREALANR